MVMSSEWETERLSEWPVYGIGEILDGASGHDADQAHLDINRTC